MHASTAPRTIYRTERTTRLAWHAVLTGGLAIAALDFAYCLLFWGPQGASPMQIFQGVAAGALGKASFSGGIATALLGLGFQLLIGSAFVLAYALIARHVPDLRRRPVEHGLAYGLALNLVMTRIVVPLSAFPSPDVPNLAWMLTNIPMFCVFGLVAVQFARRAVSPR